MVEVWLPYGKTEVCVRVPTSSVLDIVEPNEGAGAEDPQAEIENALMNPVGMERLADSVKPGAKVCLVLKASRSSADRVMVSAILKELSVAGVKDEDVTEVVAYDPFVVSSPQEKPVPLGEALAGRVALFRHDCEADEHAFVGKTSRGTEVYLNKRFADSDVKLLAGVVEPHPLAGYCGGRECVLPGISSGETIQHSLSLGMNAKAGRGSLEGNRVHEDMVEASRLGGVDFTLNVVRNCRLEVVKAYAGDLDKAFDEAVRLTDEIHKVSVKGRADIVFVSPGGFPFDSNLLEALRSMDAAVELTKRGKAVVLVAECLDGYGIRDLYEAMSRYKSARDLEKALKKSFNAGGFMAYRLMTGLQRAGVILVSSMPDYYVSETFGMKSARTANEAFGYASGSVGKNGRVSFIPYGNLTMPVIRAAD
ncbi:MAG: nickel-dependent lactate racemase [Candidatus Bathyarchaeota archaeon]|nr:nickel-dependent lactate racemase [Candidatus Bathyarchaeota archaeon]